MPLSFPRLTATVCIALVAASANAQEPPNAYESATQPGPGTFIFKPQLRYFDLNDAPASRWGETHQLNFSNTLNFGIARDWSASVRFPLEQRWQSSSAAGGSEESFGVGDLTTLLKWRVWRNDTSPLDTQRLAVFVGLEWPLGQSEFSSRSFDPVLGAAYTQVTGRHGVNLSGAWKFTTDGDDAPLLAGEGQADLFRYDAAYLFRIHPEQYTADTKGAWYAGFELNGLYETNGDHEVFLSPGIMYEAQSWVLELSVQLPVIQRLDWRPETDFAVVFGLRFLF
ncbi:MAG: hypothetical protein IT450_09545 [Phycisphaerales bacterium]|nr:hypothetical protein [Phycisphaerales bacterium]